MYECVFDHSTQTSLPAQIIMYTIHIHLGFFLNKSYVNSKWNSHSHEIYRIPK